MSPLPDLAPLRETAALMLGQHGAHCPDRRFWASLATWLNGLADDPPASDTGREVRAALAIAETFLTDPSHTATSAGLPAPDHQLRRAALTAAVAGPALDPPVSGHQNLAPPCRTRAALAGPGPRGRQGLRGLPAHRRRGDQCSTRRHRHLTTRYGGTSRPHRLGKGTVMHAQEMALAELLMPRCRRHGASWSIRPRSRVTYVVLSLLDPAAGLRDVVAYGSGLPHKMLQDQADRASRNLARDLLYELHYRHSCGCDSVKIFPGWKLPDEDTRAAAYTAVYAERLHGLGSLDVPDAVELIRAAWLAGFEAASMDLTRIRIPWMEGAAADAKQGEAVHDQTGGQELGHDGDKPDGQTDHAGSSCEDPDRAPGGLTR
jgi:hypothetical protein